MKRKSIKRELLLAIIMLSISFFTIACGHTANKNLETQSKSSDAIEVKNSNGYSDGIYRGFYYDQDIEQVSVQFELSNGKFTEVRLRSLKYKDVDYLSERATDIQMQIATQYQQVTNYLVGKGVESIDNLQAHQLVVKDMDAVTSATLNTEKMTSAMKDGLKRNVFKVLPSSNIRPVKEAEDGVYRGVYNDGGVEQVSVEFEVKDNKFMKVTYLGLNYGERDYLKENDNKVSKQISDQYNQAAEYLVGKSIIALKDLYSPGALIQDYDAVTGATLKTNKLISAINDGFNHNQIRR